MYQALGSSAGGKKLSMYGRMKKCLALLFVLQEHRDKVENILNRYSITEAIYFKAKGVIVLHKTHILLQGAVPGRTNVYSLEAGARFFFLFLLYILKYYYYSSSVSMSENQGRMHAWSRMWLLYFCMRLLIAWSLVRSHVFRAKHSYKISFCINLYCCFTL